MACDLQFDQNKMVGLVTNEDSGNVDIGTGTGTCAPEDRQVHALLRCVLHIGRLLLRMPLA